MIHFYYFNRLKNPGSPLYLEPESRGTRSYHLEKQMTNILTLLKKNRPSVENYLWRGLQLFLKGILTVFVLFIAAGNLDPREFGVFNYLTALIGLFIIFCDFGLSVSTSRYVAEHAVLDKSRLSSLLFSVLILVAAISGFLSLIIMIAGKFFLPRYYTSILLFIPYLFLLPLTSVLDGYYRGLKRFRDLCVSYFLVGIVSIPLSLFLIRQFQLRGAVSSLSFIYVAAAFLLFLFVKKTPFSFDKGLLKKVSGYALLIGIANVSYFMYTKADILILKQFGYVVEIGYYAMIDKIFNILLLPSVILGQVIAPTVSRYAALSDFGHLKRKYKKYISLLFFLALPLSLALYFIITFGIRTFLPAYYTGAFRTILRLLLILFPLKIASICAVVGFITPSGFARIITISTLAGGILNVLLDYVLITSIGFTGVFYSTLIVHSLIMIITNIIFFKQAFGSRAARKGGTLAV
ncbi:MAG: oligosaccharide flippase family protein [Candidatus Omnitrophica bacterium]|nr:oligosaccharide flippase family protein [Candidatus Omnitrophota bacterium]